jgi:hypothetical protein
VGGVWGGRTGSALIIFNLIVERKKMGELTSQVSNGPDSFFGSRADAAMGKCG